MSQDRRTILITGAGSGFGRGAALELARRVRRGLGVPVGVLGSQVTFTPDEIFERDSVDFVVRGEPEHTVRDVARRVAAGEGLAGVEGTAEPGIYELGGPI